MKKIKIAILDDGMDREILHEIPSIIEYMNGEKESCWTKIPRHGTRVLATIEKYNKMPKEYRIYNIYKENKALYNVCKILEELIYNPVDVIVMSFIIKNKAVYGKITELCKELYTKGTILVASDANRKNEWVFPAALSEVIGVGQAFCPRDSLIWNDKREIQLSANVMPEFVWVGDKPWLFNGTSKANGIVAAKVMEVLSNGICGYDKVLEELRRLGENYDNKNVREDRAFCNLQINNELIHILQQEGYQGLSENENIPFRKIANGLDELGELVWKILQEYHMQSAIEYMEYYDFETSYALANFIEQGKSEKRNETKEMEHSIFNF